MQRFEWISSSDLRIDRQILTFATEMCSKKKWIFPFGNVHLEILHKLELQGTSPMENDEKELKEMEIRALFPLKRKERERKSATKSDVDF